MARGSEWVVLPGGGGVWWVIVVGVDGRGRVDVCGYVLEIWIENHPFAICVL